MIGKDDVTYIARLARLNLSETEIKEFTGQLDEVIEYVRQLDSAPTQGVEPTAFVAPKHDPFRDDIARPSLPPEELLANGPEVKKGFFAIPKVIKQ